VCNAFFYVDGKKRKREGKRETKQEGAEGKETVTGLKTVFTFCIFLKGTE
jgi:hypothetical protein